MNDAERSEDIQAAIEAREAAERARAERGARELANILEEPHSGMSRRFTFGMFGSEEGEESEEEGT